MQAVTTKEKKTSEMKIREEARKKEEKEKKEEFVLEGCNYPGR
jgi:hypothetical protein